jgi:hypothetical protein
MANPDTLLPIDETVKIPEAVRRASAAADAYYAKPAPSPEPAPQPATPPAGGDQPVNIVAVPAPAAPAEPRPLLSPQPAPQPAPQPEPPPADQLGTAEQEHHRYLSMKGRYEQATQTMGQMQEQLRELGDAVHQLTERQPAPQQQRPQPVRLLTPEDEHTYGPDLIDMTRRAAREALAPELTEIQRRQDELARNEQRLKNQHTLDALDAQLPGWRDINVSPAFLDWLRLPDVYSGGVRGNLLKQAFQAASVPRVLAFFKGYLAEAQATGQLPDPTTTAVTPTPPREPAVPLETLTSPGRAQPAPGNSQVSTDKPHFTRRQVQEFYSHAGMERYRGREADRKADEQLIFEAQREGRITG